MVRTIQAATVLDAWERGYGAGSIERGLALLNLAHPQEPPERLASMSIGQRDASLLKLRARLFGSKLLSLSACPGCGARTELEFQVERLLIRETSVEEQCCVVAERIFKVRPPSSRDLLAVAAEPDLQSQRRALLKRCLGEISHAADLAGTYDGRGEASASSEAPCGGETGAPAFSEEDETRLVEAIAAADPQADVRLAANCTECGHFWSSPFDIVAFLWAEIDAWARRVIAEVHVLATAYGWTESEVVSMSPWRRRLYLEMVRQ